MQPGLYRRLTDPENLRGLGDVQMLHVPKNEDFSINVRQFVKRLPDSASHFRLLYDRLKLLGAEIMTGLNELQLPGLDLGEAKRMANSAVAAVKQGQLGYALICAKKTD